MKQINMNSIKNTRVRVKDIKQGRTIYIAHPVYGIKKVVIVGRPYKLGGSLFAKCYVTPLSGDKLYVSDFSLCNAGITDGASYNGRRAFFKRKQAVAWMDKWQHDYDFNMQQKRHEEHCSMLEEIDDEYDGDWGWSGY